MNILEELHNLGYIPYSPNSEYINKDGVIVPRVTEILSTMIHKDALMYWANKLGFRNISYSSALETAANIGTKAHKAIEVFLKEKLQDRSNIPFLGFMQWYNIIRNKSQIDIIYVEHRLVSDYFGGTLDCLLSIDGKIFLVDFKTSNHIQYSYFLQLAAYRYMLRLEGIEVNGVIVLKLEKDEVGFTEYSLDFSNSNHLDFMNHCEATFFSLVYGFYNINKTEEWFKKIFKKRGMEKNNGN